MKEKKEINHQILKLLFSFTFLIVLATALSFNVSAATKYWIGDGVNLSIDQDHALFVDTGANYVGIGTTSPGAHLHIFDSAQSAQFVAGHISDSPAYGAIGFAGTLTSANYALASTGASATTLQSIAGQHLNLAVGGSIKIKITDVGDVGIGTTSPAYKLDVSGNVRLNNTLYVNETGNVGIGDPTPDYKLDVETSTGSAIYGHVSAASGSSFGVWGESDSTAGRGVYAHATAASGSTYGVWGESDSTDGRGVYGHVSAASGTTYGVWGGSDSTDGRGVYARATAASGTTYGVYSQSDSTSGRGVYGYATAASGTTYGVYGLSVSTSGRGVYGYASGASGTTYGVYGQSASTAGYGVYGQVTSATGYAGYFTGGYGLRINGANFERSSVGNIFGCSSVAGGIQGEDCNAVCGYRGLTCFTTEIATSNGWASPADCTTDCVLMPNNGRHLCWCQ